MDEKKKKKPNKQTASKLTLHLLLLLLILLLLPSARFCRNLLRPANASANNSRSSLSSCFKHRQYCTDREPGPNVWQEKKRPWSVQQNFQPLFPLTTLTRSLTFLCCTLSDCRELWVVDSLWGFTVAGWLRLACFVHIDIEKKLNWISEFEFQVENLQQQQQQVALKSISICKRGDVRRRRR